jgi:hypothetical protein
MLAKPYGAGLRILPVSKLTKNSTMKTTNNTCAIHADVPARPVKPKAAAMIATTKNMSAQYNMTLSFKVNYLTSQTYRFVAASRRR